MKIEDLFQDLVEYSTEFADIEISGIQSDSRKVKAGDLFIAVTGDNVDGHDYIDNAIKSGAAAVLAENENNLNKKNNVPIFYNKNLKIDLYKIAVRFFSNPSSSMKIIGITGTNGKTSTSYFLKNILQNAGYKIGLIGTIQYLIGAEVQKAVNTTPNALELQRILADMKDKNIDIVIMEVSSHALSLKRVGGIDFDVAVFTNITEDHLDFHGTMEDYLKAKLSFIDYLKDSKKLNKKICYKNDIEYLNEIFKKIQESEIDAWSYGIKGEADFKADNPVATLNETSYFLKTPEFKSKIQMSARGFFAIYNSLAACCAACVFGVSDEGIVSGLKDVSIPGRFEIVDNSHGFLVIVDYAHTDDALRSLIESAKKLKPKKIITLFGCGGNRDRKKRAIMGSVASGLSDTVIVTSDNPRKEDPKVIIDDILKGIDPQVVKLHVIEERELAIKKAISEAGVGDVVLLAGKGHEDYQIFSDRTIHFSDKEVAAKILGEL